MNLLDLYAGGGGFHLAAQIAEFYFEKVYFAEINEYANKIYEARFPDAVAVGDVRGIRYENFPAGDNWFVTAGFPCQPFSVAGSRLGAADDRYHWNEVLRISKEFRADGFIYENVAGIESIPFKQSETRMEVRRHQRAKGYDIFEAVYSREEDLQLARCCQDLEEAGAAFKVFEIPALSVNAWHKRNRIWIVGTFTDFDLERRFGRSESGQDRKRKIYPRRGNGRSRSEDSLRDKGSDTDSSIERTGDATEKNDAGKSESGEDDLGHLADDHEKREFQPERRKRTFGQWVGNGDPANFADTSGAKCGAFGKIQDSKNRKIVGRSSRTSSNDHRRGRKEQWKSEQVKTKHSGIELGNSDITDDQSVRQKESCFKKSFFIRQASGFDTHSQWERHWLEVAAELCRDDDGLRNELDTARLRHDLKRLYPQITEADIEKAIDRLETEYRRLRIELSGNSVVPQIPAEFFKVFKKLFYG